MNLFIIKVIAFYFYFYLYFYKKLDKKIKLSNTVNQELNVKQNKITTYNIINKIDDINEKESYKEKMALVIFMCYKKIFKI